MSETPQPQYLQPGTRIGPYEVVWLLGTGGYGAVYKVRLDGTVYALKLSNQDASELADEHRHGYEQRAQREYDVLAQLTHPNIVRVHHFGWWPRPGAFPYLVMDFIEGLAFQRWVTRDAPPLGRVVAALAKVARALDELHRRGVCHRDLKSENLLVRPDGEPVLIDLGLAQVDGAPPLTGAQAFIGTYKHWAPEYAAFIASDAHRRGERFPHAPASDLHALGYLLYEALTGRPPFTSDDYDLFGLLHEIREVVPEAPHALNPLAPVALSDFTMRLLAKDPAGRPASGIEVAEGLEQILAEGGDVFTRPLPTPPPPPREGTPSEWRTRSTLTPGTYGRIMEGNPGNEAPPPPSPEKREASGRVWLSALAVASVALGVWAPQWRAAEGWRGDWTSTRVAPQPPRMLTVDERRTHPPPPPTRSAAAQVKPGKEKER